MPLQAMSELVLEHGESPRARRLRQNRFRIAVALTALEGILVLAGAIPWWVVVALAAGSVALYVALRGSERIVLVQLAWIAAFSQVALVLVPVVAAFVAFLAIALVVMFAVVALVALARDRR
jgi:hypothetical protein